LTVWAIVMGLAGFTMVWLGRYTVFERIPAVLVGIMFVTVVGLAIIAAPNIPELLRGLIPLIPDGGVVYTLALAGGVGGTITLAA
ncbi:divalent metal cation transporter, partial [Burkholderia multivorans]